MTAGASRLKALVETARDHAPEARRALLRNVTDLLLMRPDGLNAAEMQHFDAILTFLLRETSPALRREIADRLADAPAAPRGVLRQLALDDINVADPVLRRAGGLTDADLMAVIAERGGAHARAIARRRDVSERLSGALVETGDEDVLLNLARNQGARFDLAAMQAMIAEAKRRPDLQEPLTGRYDLPPQLLTQLYFFVSSTLKRDILSRADLLEPSLVDVAAAASRRRLLEQAAREAAAEQSDAKRFIAEKMRLGAINEALLGALITDRRHTEFVYAFAWLAGVELAAAQTILKDRSFEALALVCRAARMERQFFARIVFSLRRDEASKAKALRILDLYLKVPEEAAGRLMRFWRMRTQAGRDAAFMDYDDDGDETD
jgi:uncharacterized protein (DUF2336 family)